MNRLPLPLETPEHEIARAFGCSIAAAPAHDADRGLSIRETWRRAAELGFFELLIPRDQLDVEDALSSLEGLGEGCQNGGFLLALGAHCFGVGAPLAKFGRDTHQDYLCAMRHGDAIAALAATEYEAGSDLMSLATRFTQVADGYVLDGAKCFVTNVEEADLFLVLATRDPRLHARGISAFLVAADTPGLRRGTDEPRLGLHGCSIGSLFLDHVVVPERALLGRIDGGAAIVRHAMLWERSLIVAAQVGILRRQLVTSLTHAQTRRQFQRSIGSNQYVAGRIVDLLARYLTSRLLVRDSVAKLAVDALTPGQASLVKLWVSESALASSLDAFRTFGGSGFMQGSPLGTELLDSLGGLIYSGTSDMQKVIVAAELGLVG